MAPRRLATLHVQGWNAGAWTAHDCVTGDGRYLAVVFGPSEYANDAGLRDGQAFAATVDLKTGDVWIVPERVALHYYNPGCGTGSLVTWSRQSETDGKTTVELVTADARRRVVVGVTRTASDLSSPVPLVDGSFFAADGRGLVRVRPDGTLARVATADGPVYSLRPNAGGGVDYLVAEDGVAAVHRLDRSGARRLGEGALTQTVLARGRDGRNRLITTDPDAAVSGLPLTLAKARPLAASLDGGTLLLGATGGTSVGDPVSLGLSQGGIESEHLVASAPGANARTSVSDPLTTSSSTSGTSDYLTAAPASSSPCSVAPLDPGTQIIQPNPAQVEWAAHKAVRGELTTARPANWQKHGLPAYSPQSVFPRPTIGGGTVPVQVLLGVLAQESNFKQASSVALPGVPSDPLIGNYYGTVYDSNGYIIGADSSKADCGYGVGQITTNMKTSATAWSAQKKRQVATDYQVNAAAAVSFLENNWNQLKQNRMLPNDGDPSKIENWYLALWAYNTGFYAPNGTSPWGVGWTNNPAQNDYDPSRRGFLDAGYQDAKYPNRWPYQERVLGWAVHPQQDFQTGGFKYRGAKGPLRSAPYFTFCEPAINNCDPASTSTGYCLSADRRTCWWHGKAQWFDPNNPLEGTPEDFRNDLPAAEPTVSHPYPPSCAPGASPVRQLPGTQSLPDGAVVIDDQPDSSSNIAGCPAGFVSSGSFTLKYGTDAEGDPSAAIDTHQLGVGLMGHSYFARSIESSRSHVLVRGTWTPPSSVIGWQRVWVHLPDNGADSHQARYEVFTGTKTVSRTVNQRWNANTWVDLGSFLFTSGAKVSLSNATYEDHDVRKYGPVDVSWDAVAFTPSSKPSLAYVALGDSYQAGEGVEPYYSNADAGRNGKRVNACHRSPQAYSAGVFADLSTLRTGARHYHFPACSGAVITDVSGTGVQFAEVPQLQQGWLDENTTHVTVGIGGNDARFADILFGCIVTLKSCTAPDYHLTIKDENDNKVVDPEPLITYEPKVIDRLSGDLRRMFDSIRTKAPNARVVAVGYPHVLASSLRRSAVGCSQLSQENIDFFAAMGDRLNRVVRDAATSAGVGFVDTVEAFAGPPSHEACTFDTNVEWINAIVTSASSGSGSSNPGPGSFHPKASGHQEIRRLLGLAML